MNTKTIVAALVALSASSAFAGLKLETRTDYQNSAFSDANTAAAGQTNGYSTTQISRARLGFGAKVSEELSLDGRLDLLNTATQATAPVAGAPAFVDYAAIMYKAMPALTISMGKLNALGGGMENQYNFGDLYLVSALDGFSAPANAGGIQADYAIGDHTLSLQVLNDVNQSSQKNNASKSHPIVQYYGNFLDKKLQAIVSYDSAKGPGAYADKNKTITTLGVKYDFGVALLDVDYTMLTDEAGSTLSATAGKKDEVTGFVVNVAVPVSSWKVYVKAESTATKNDGNKLATLTNMGLAGEYALTKDGSSNFHVAYNSLSAKNEASTGTVSGNGLTVANAKTATEAQVIAGFKLYADILK